MGVKVGEGGKLYGSITTKDIGDALARRGIDVDRHKIDLEEPLKSLGTYKVAIKVYARPGARGHDRRRAQGVAGGAASAPPARPAPGFCHPASRRSFVRAGSTLERFDAVRSVAVLRAPAKPYSGPN